MRLIYLIFMGMMPGASNVYKNKMLINYTTPAGVEQISNGNFL